MNLIGIIEQIGFKEITISAVIIRLLTSLTLGFFISRICKLYNKNEPVQSDMLHSLIFLNVIICSAMMVIGNNLASAFGLVGAVSIIRFRTSVKSSRDMSFVFFTIVTGMASGLGYILISILSFIIIATSMVLIYYVQNISDRSSPLSLNLKVSYLGNFGRKDEIIAILNTNCKSVKMIDIKSTKSKITINYRLRILDWHIIDSINDSLNKLDVVDDLKLQFDNISN